MAWLDDDALLGRPYEMDDYREHTRGVEVAAMVYLEVDLAAHYTLLEARWAAAQDGVSGVVAHAPVEYGDQVRGYLEALVKLGPRVKGVRRITQSEADPGLLRAARVRARCTHAARVRLVVRCVHRAPPDAWSDRAGATVPRDEHRARSSR